LPYLFGRAFSAKMNNLNIDYQETEIYQKAVVTNLQAIFGKRNVREEWDVATGSTDGYKRELYCPVIDVAVGPFNTNGEVDINTREINLTVENYKPFITKLLQFSETEVGSLDEFLNFRNHNPRCFLAIEIEKSGTRKHLLGDVANTSIIGAIGIVVPLDQSKLNGFKAIKKYIKFATSVGKLPPNFNNVLVIRHDNFLRIIN